ncbi:MAG: GlsB/YeaQ/YmgE family stress response membrane protein, partial [Candidatus Eisenbacteria bacterium]
MNIVWSIIIGFVVGLLAKFIMPGKDPGGFIVTVLIGIGGALVANYLGRAMGWYGP